MAKKSIEQIYNILFNMRDELAALEQDASTVLGGATEYGGEISRVMTEQLTKFFIPAIQKLSSSEDTPGSIMGLIRFLDSVPLSMTRPNPEKNYPTPVQGNDELELPAATEAAPEDEEPVEPSTYIPGTNDPVDNIPRGVSFANPMGEPSEGQMKMMASTENQSENKLTESYKKYQVVRQSSFGSSINKDTKIRENVVAEFDTKELAEARANSLNETLTEAEKDFLKCSYSVKEKEFN